MIKNTLPTYLELKPLQWKDYTFHQGGANLIMQVLKMKVKAVSQIYYDRRRDRRDGIVRRI
jgi:hypothetical protein